MHVFLLVDKISKTYSRDIMGMVISPLNACILAISSHWWHDRKYTGSMCIRQYTISMIRRWHGSCRLVSLQWRHNGHDSVSNHQPHDCLLNRLYRRRSKKTSKIRVTGLCAGNSPGTGEFPTKMANNAENVSIWWRHHIVNRLLWAVPVFLVQNLVDTIRVIYWSVLSAVPSSLFSFTYVPRYQWSEMILKYTCKWTTTKIAPASMKSLYLKHNNDNW